MRQSERAKISIMNADLLKGSRLTPRSWQNPVIVLKGVFKNRKLHGNELPWPASELALPALTQWGSGAEYDRVTISRLRLPGHP